MLKWYLEHGPKVTAVHKYLKYEPGQSFSWFPEEVSKARPDGDNDLALKQLDDMFKLKRNSFYGKIMEDLIKQLKTTFTINEELVDKSSRSPFLKDLEEINTAFKIKQCKWQVNIMRPYQCGIAIYQLAKLRMLEFYCEFLDKCLDWCNFKLIQVDTDSMYIAISGEFAKIVRPELQEEYDHCGKAEFLSASKYHDKMLGLFKAEFQGMRMITLMSKCYYTKDDKSHLKISCKGIRKKQHSMSWA